MTLAASEKKAVSAATLHTASRWRISRALEELWPDRTAVLGAQCPSVTSYVCRVTVDGEPLIAKHSWLGMSLVSVLRGAAGTWDDVRSAQNLYAESPQSLVTREAQHLAAIRKLGRPRVCDTAGVHGGVLVTREAEGTSLAAELVAHPADTSDFLEAALTALRDLHGPAGARRLSAVSPIGERSVIGVFRRKFLGPRSAGYLRELGQDSGLPEDERQEVAELVRRVVDRLARLLGAVSSRRETVVFGDLKPEHVFLDGGGCLRFIDPAVQWAAGSEPDVAKLTGRTLLLALGHPDPEVRRQIVDGVYSTLSRHVAVLSAGPNRDARLRELLVLWLMDTVSILSTCLSAPPDLPLANHQISLLAMARMVARMVDAASALLVGSTAGFRLLDVVVDQVDMVAGGLP
ncbi:phosphotransferase [Streptomyces sp. NPDC048416]|uniref:phosphotransferase n=1 Tax=Streptomyces sp. NPDC048416 TaxID=3365546 RepID=UPI0037230FD5